MADPNPLLLLLACPRCDKNPLSVVKGRISCKACRIEFPSIDGIPWLFAEPNASLGEWRERLNLVVRRAEHDADSADAELERSDLHELTRARLVQLSKANRDHARRLRELLKPLSMEKMQASYEMYLALRTRLPSRQGLTTYYVNVHRDWAWGEEENEASFQLVADALEQSGAPGKVLVLGAGACRLAYDIHMRLDPELTVALDINPLLLLLAQQVMCGDEVALYEFPISPKTVDDYAILRRLSVDDPVREGFYYVLADALRPPFIELGFDTVVTPWLIDIVSEDFRLFSQRINVLLRPGGHWVNFGSLTFSGQSQSSCYSLEETLALVDVAGFERPEIHEATIPYMASPSSRHARRETVLAWSASKKRDLPRTPRHSALPEWIIKGDQPVPLLQSFQVDAMSTRIYAFIMSMIDGERSLQDMARVLVEKRLMTPEEAEPAIRSFLIKMYEDSVDRPRF